MEQSAGVEQLQAQQQALHECGHVSSDLIVQGCPLSLSSADGPLLNTRWLTVCISVLNILNLKHPLGHTTPARTYCHGKAYETAGSVN